MGTLMIADGFAFLAGFIGTLAAVRAIGPAQATVHRIALSGALASIRAAASRALNRAGRGTRDRPETWVEHTIRSAALTGAAAGFVAGVGCIAWVSAAALVLCVPVTAAAAAAIVGAAQLRALRASAERRVRRIVRLLPYSVELIVLIADAGGSLEDGFVAVTRSMPSEPISEEFDRVLSEQRLGRPFLDALRGLAARIDNKETSQLVTSIEIGRELGTPLTTSLATFAEWIRTKRVLDGERLAREAAPKMALPNTMIMAANVLLILAPFLPTLTSGSVL